MRGYFGVGLENSSKLMNAGNLFRSAHAFGADFIFTVNSVYSVSKAKSDTSSAPRSIPWYDFECVEELKLPEKCSLVGVELLNEAVELPIFRHPLNAAYILGPEQGNLSPKILERCKHVVKIPSHFSLNVATTGAIILYDRIRSMGNFGKRPVSSFSKPLPPMKHVHGLPLSRKQKK